ncbi:hypothetical protein [Spirosoma panaciterrae]|uniref:hypothetical protein n=1 Tax=Spirosoma panaciterrae TaxID=496058 RepID=UPI001FE2300F|nr:hypothetical protein [Spirosoma panaciterrae]
MTDPDTFIGTLMGLPTQTAEPLGGWLTIDTSVLISTETLLELLLAVARSG